MVGCECNVCVVNGVVWWRMGEWRSDEDKLRAWGDLACTDDRSLLTTATMGRWLHTVDCCDGVKYQRGMVRACV